jgi:hypothetical protein
MVRALQKEIGDTPDLPPERARVLLNDMTRLIGNCNAEIRDADAAYAAHLLSCLDAEDKANRAKIRAETSPEFARKREARDTKELVVEMSRSLKYYLRSLEEEMRLAR